MKSKLSKNVTFPGILLIAIVLISAFLAYQATQHIKVNNVAAKSHQEASHNTVSKQEPALTGSSANTSSVTTATDSTNKTSVAASTTANQTDSIASGLASPSTSQPTSTSTPTQSPEDACETDGKVIIPVGGVSCNYTISTIDGSVQQWYLPMLSSFTDGTGATEKPDAPVYVVIETPSSSPSGPYTASSITFHYSALSSAPIGDYDDGSGGLVFSTIGPDGMPGTSYSMPVTVVAN